MKTDMQLFLYIAQFFLEWEMFQANLEKKKKKKIKTFFVQKFPTENRVLYEIMWENMIKAERWFAWRTAKTKI